MRAPMLFGASLLLGLAPSAGEAQPPGTLSVAVGNVRRADGTVRVAICPQAQFLKDCPYLGEAPASIGVTVVTVRRLPPGRYAAQVFHDRNGNGKVDRSLIGLPKEGVGFSNDAKISFGPPKFADAAFTFDGQARTIDLKLRYFLGAGTRN